MHAFSFFSHPKREGSIHLPTPPRSTKSLRSMGNLVLMKTDPFLMGSCGAEILAKGYFIGEARKRWTVSGRSFCKVIAVAFKTQS